MNLFDISDDSDNDIDDYLKDTDNNININYLNNELSDNDTDESIDSNIINNINFIKYKKYNSDKTNCHQDNEEINNEVNSLISSIDLH